MIKISNVFQNVLQESAFESFLVLIASVFVCGFYSCSASAQTEGSVTPIKDSTLQGRIELNNLEKTNAPDTPAHHWSSIGTDSYIQGDMDKAEQSFSRALSAADSSKLSANQKAQLIANLASVKREKHEYDESEKLFKKSLDVLRAAPSPDANLHEYIMKQFRRLYRLQGRDSEADFLIDNAASAPQSSQVNAKYVKQQIQQSPIASLKELPQTFCGLEISTKIEAMPPEQVAGKLFVESKEKPDGDYRDWYRIPKGLAGKWIAKEMIDMRMIDLPSGYSTHSAQSGPLVPGVRRPSGLQIDAKGDIWDFDRRRVPFANLEAAIGFKSINEITHMSTISNETDAICMQTSESIFLVDAATNKTISMQRFQMLQRLVSLAKDSFSFSMVTVEYDASGTPKYRVDYQGVAIRDQEFQKDDRYKESFIKFLKAKGLDNLIPR